MGFISKSPVLLGVLFNHLMRNIKIPVIYNRWVSPGMVSGDKHMFLMVKYS
jgi:hypothetical protein